MTGRQPVAGVHPPGRSRHVVALLGILSIGALAALAVLAVKLSSDAAREQARGQVSAAATASAAAIEAEMLGMADVVASFAGRPSLRAALTDDDGTVDDVVRSHLEALQSSRPVISIAFVTDPDGILVDIVPATPSIVGDDFSFRDWYRGAIAKGRPYVSEVYETAAAGGGLVVGVAAPIRATADPTSAVVGVIVAGYRLDSIQHFADTFAAAHGVDIRVADQRGTQYISLLHTGPTVPAWKRL